MLVVDRRRRAAHADGVLLVVDRPAALADARQLAAQRGGIDYGLVGEARHALLVQDLGQQGIVISASMALPTAEACIGARRPGRKKARLGAWLSTRSAERRGRKACVGSGRSRWSPHI